MCSFCLNNTTVGRDQLTGHHAKGTESLRKDIALHVTIIVLSRPDETSRGLDNLCDHIINKPMFVIDACLFELRLVCRFVYFLEDVFKSAVVLFHDGVFRGHELSKTNMSAYSL